MSSRSILAGLGALLNAGILYLAVGLFWAPRNVAPDPNRGIALPFEDDDTLWEPYRRWVVQEDGRKKPFDTFCRETVRTITGRERFEAVRSTTTGRVLRPGHDPVAVVVSWLMLDEGSDSDGRLAICDWERHPFILCRDSELRRLLYEEQQSETPLTDQERFGHHVEPALLRRSAAFAKLLHEAMQRRESDSRVALPLVEREALEVHTRLEMYDRVRRAARFQVVALDGAGPSWFSLQNLRDYTGEQGEQTWARAMRNRRLENGEFDSKLVPPRPFAEIGCVLAAYTALQDAYRSGEAPRFATSSQAFFSALADTSGRFQPYPGCESVDWELWYNRANPFRKAWVFSLIAAALLAGSLVPGLWGRRSLYVAGLGTSAGCLAWAVAGFVGRVVIAGRPPVSNMYESLIWVALMALVFGVLLEAIYRRGVIALAAALVSTLGFVLADQLPLTFSPALQPLQAVLRSNYWLVVHVLVIVSSYAPFALAWGLGNLNLGLILFAPGRRDAIQALSRFGYRAIQIGVLLLFLGTMLGGSWGAKSWGRFWGWDPKEVWALIALLCYIIPLHARYVGWIRDFGLAACSVICFSSVVMAWYGVNFVLGAGLHSYGFGSGDDRWIYLASLANISLVVHGAWCYRAAWLGSDRK